MDRTYVKILAGSYRNAPIVNTVFPLLKQYQHSAKGGFITVDGSHMFGPEKTKIRIVVSHFNDAEPSDYDSYLEQGVEPTVQCENITVSRIEETDEEVMTRIAERFDILHDMTKAACDGTIRAMIVGGVPGVGKSFIVEEVLNKASMFDRIAGRTLKHEIVKGMATPIGLYQLLYKFSDKDNVIVFDDCDNLFYDDLCLNLLKSALDTSKRRKINWVSESNVLRREDIPASFDFKGSIIFITNINFTSIKSKKLQEHLAALESRCHYLDLTLNTTRDKLLRIKQVVAAGELFSDYSFTENQQNEIVDFLFDNHKNLREISLRTCIKTADLFRTFPSKWQHMAKITIMRTMG